MRIIIKQKKKQSYQILFNEKIFKYNINQINEETSIHFDINDNNSNNNKRRLSNADNNVIEEVLLYSFNEKKININKSPSSNLDSNNIIINESPSLSLDRNNTKIKNASSNLDNKK